MAGLLRILTVALMIIAAAITGAGPVSAHTVLTATDPAADATLSAGPNRVSATFNEDLQATFAAMTVVGPDGNLWSSGETEVRGPVASVGVRPLGPSGRYTANYRVTSEDGHVVSGSWSFTVTVPSTGAPGPSVSGMAESQRISLWPFIIGAGLLAAGGVAWVVRRRS